MEKNLFDKIPDVMVPVMLCRDERVAELGGDFTLPDYEPGIRKLLRVSVRLSAPSQYPSGNAVKLAGSGEYDILYVGNDGEVYHAALPTSFEISSPLDESRGFDMSEGIEISSDIAPESVICRVTGERKLNIKCRIAARVLAYGKKKLSASGIPDGDHVQLLIKGQDFWSEACGVNSDMEAVDELDSLSQSDRYICTDARVLVEDTKAFEGYAECRGNIYLRHLICSKSGNLALIQRKLPFNESVEVDGLNSGDLTVGYGWCSEITSVEAGAEIGEESPLSVKAHINLKVSGYSKNVLSYVKDAYSTEYETELENEETELFKLTSCNNKNMTLTASVGADCLGNIDRNAVAVDTVAYAAAENVEINDAGHYVISGKCRFNMLFAENNGETEYSAVDAEVPFKYECSDGGEPPEHFTVNVEAINAGARMEGENISLWCELCLSYSLCGDDEMVSVCRMTLGETHERSRRGFTVCYPDSEDSLWSISKKYSAAVAKTAASNGLDCASDADTCVCRASVKYIIV